MMRATGRKVRATGVTRLLYVLLALTVALSSLSVPAVATDRVVGNPDGLEKAPAHGVNAITTTVSQGSDIKVEIVDKLSRYAVDMTFDTSRLTVSPGERIWNVDTLQYEYDDKSEGQWFANHRIEIGITNYSDLGIFVDCDVTVNHPDCGYTIRKFTTVPVNGCFILESNLTSFAPVQAEVAVVLSIPSWTVMADALTKKEGALDENDSCKLGSFTIIIRPNDHT